MAGPVAVICAMDWELAHLRNLLPDGQQIVVLAASGIGMTSAAASAQDVIVRHAPRAVLNYGCAGAHRQDLLLGDIVVGTHAIAYADPGATALPADPDLLDAARSVAETYQHELWPTDLGWPLDVPHRPPRVAFGVVASADLWNRTPATIAPLVARHHSLCEDMEAAAIAAVCARHHVPFLSLKDISNNELLRPTTDGQSMLTELGVDQIARRAASFTRAILDNL